MVDKQQWNQAIRSADTVSRYGRALRTGDADAH